MFAVVVVDRYSIKYYTQSNAHIHIELMDNKNNEKKRVIEFTSIYHYLE